MKIQREQLNKDNFTEVEPLMDKYGREITRRKLSVNWELLSNMLEYSRDYWYITARTNDGTLVGFILLVSVDSLYFRDEVEAHQIGLFILSEYRGRMIHSLLLGKAVEVVGDAVDSISIDCSAEHDTTPAMVRAGFELKGKAFSRRVG